MKSCKSFEDQESHAWCSLSGSLCPWSWNRKLGHYSENTVGQDTSLFCLCNQTDAKTSPGLLPRSPVTQPGFIMFVRGFGVLGSSKMQFVPVSGRDYRLMKWWFSQLVEAGAGGKPILFLVWSRYLPGMSGTISRFQHRFSVGCGYMKKHDTKQLEYCHYWE